MFKGMKKIISVAMAAAMAVTTIAPSASITANAATQTLSSVLGEGASKELTAKDANDLSQNLEGITPTTTHFKTSGAAMTWAKKYIKGKSGEQLTIVGANEFKENVTYTVTYSNITLDGSGRKFDLKIAINGYHSMETASKKRWIAVTEEKPGSILYSGFKSVGVKYTITDHGKSTMEKALKTMLFFDDIDSWQGLEIKTPGRLVEASLGKELSKGYSSKRAKDSGSDSILVSENAVICKSGDNNQKLNNEKYQLRTRLNFTNANHSFTIRYYTGGADEDSWQGETQSADKDDKYASEPVFLGFGSLDDSDSDQKIIFSASKTVNDKTEETLKNTSETFTYKVKSCEIGNAVGDVMKKFTLTVNETGKKTAANNVVVTDTIPSEYKVLKETQKGVEFMCREMEQIYSNQ